MNSLLTEPLARRTMLPELNRSEVWDGIWNVRAAIRYPRQPKNPARRARCERDLRDFMLEYFPQHIWELNAFHEEAIAIDREAILLHSPYVIRNAEAAPRGIGKTTEKRIAVMWAVQCYRHGPFAVFFGATGPKAKENIDFIRAEWRTNNSLREDFPEIVDWLDSFQHDSRLCKYKTPHAEWSDNALYLPWGGYIEAYGMENSLQGTNIRGVRPWWLIFEDTEGLDVASSIVLRGNLKARVLSEAMNMLDKNSAGIASIVGTIYTPDSFMAEITTRELHPEWNGRRYSGIKKFPQREDLWNDFEAAAKGQLAQTVPLAGDDDICSRLNIDAAVFAKFNSDFRRALGLYVQNFDAMNEGAELLDTKREQFSLFNLMYEKAINPAGFWHAVQNDPKPQDGTIITETKIEHLLPRCIGPARGIVPEWASVVLVGIDVGCSVAKGLHTVVEAFGPNGGHCMIDCWIEDVLTASSTMIDERLVKIATLEAALLSALERVSDRAMQGYVKMSTGELMMPALLGIDVRGTWKDYAWQPKIVEFCRRGENRYRWRPMLGQSWRQSNISDAQSAGILNGQWLKTEIEKGGLWLRNSDYWIGQLDEAHKLAPLDRDGRIMPKARIFHADAPRRFLHQQCNYKHVSPAMDDVESKVKIGWLQVNQQPVDFFDASAMALNLLDVWKWEQAQMRPVGMYRPRAQTGGGFLHS